MRMQICDKLLREVMVDEHVLNVCGMVMRSLQRPNDMTAAYEAAAAARPRDVGLLRALFAAYVRGPHNSTQPSPLASAGRHSGALKTISTAGNPIM